MLPTSDLYKQFIYTTEYARHFIPEAIIKVVDVFANYCTYSAEEMLPFSNRLEMTDDVVNATIGYGTCEYNQFLLAGNMEMFSESMHTEGSVPTQVGIMSTRVSNSEGIFETPFIVNCQYDYVISAGGRSIFFNDKEQSYPVDFDLDYYRDDTFIQKIEVRDNNNIVYSHLIGVKNFNKIVMTFYKTKNPFSRVKIIEDRPGVYIEYSDDSIISLNYVTTVDFLSNEILTSEIDLMIRNDDKALDILNPFGLENYVQRRQAIQINLIMVYPDNTTEVINVGKLYTTSWKANKGSLTASFTARDILDRLSQGEYVKAVLSTSLVSYYSLAEAILIDAGIEDYSIDNVLKTMYTYGLIPICSHKEAIRYIAQATKSVVLPMLNGSVKIKYIGIPEDWYDAVDELDYSMLYDAPSISLEKAVKSVTTVAYTYTPDTDVSEIYSGTRSMKGQETFTVKYSVPATEISVDISDGTLISTELYTNAAIITVSAGTTEQPLYVTITISGKKITTTETIHTVTNELDNNLVLEAEEIKIENPLITVNEIAEEIVNYTAYWSARRYRYSFDWRQNPALELGDAIVVHDDFSRDNTTILIEQTLEFNDGALSGTSKSLY